MLVDLVQTTTRDGIRLDGIYLTPPCAPVLPVDAFVLVHGTGGNFYSSTLFDDWPGGCWDWAVVCCGSTRAATMASARRPRPRAVAVREPLTRW